MRRAVVVGAGIFGVTSALALRGRGWSVTLVDPGPIPHPLAESTDISKIVRLDYGADELYTRLMERALEGWRAWNATWPEPLFHETGVLFLAEHALAPGGFEHDSAELLRRRGHRIEAVGASELRARFPAFSGGTLRHGYFNPQGGYAESGRVVELLVRQAVAAGVTLAAGAAARLLERGAHVAGVVVGDRSLEADLVVAAAGSWTGHLVPWLAPHFRATGHPVLHLDPGPSGDFDAARFPVFAADISRTGYYGFPRHAGVVKVANHGVGRAVDAQTDERAVRPEELEALRAFLARAIPPLASAPVARTRLCVYGDTWDQHLWIARDPEHPGLLVAAGGSGHGFKFAPLLGELVLGAVDDEGIPRFRHRPQALHATGEELARHQG